MKKRIMSITAVVVAFAAITGVLLFGQENETKIAVKAADSETKESYQSMQKKVVEEKEEPYVSEIDFDALWDLNPDIYAWITVPETNINYPVLWTDQEEDDYYLYHTPEREANITGSIYTEKYNAKDFSDPLTIMYGHTLMDGTMFSELHKYSDKEFFDANPYFYIYLPEKKLKYQIFAAVAVDDRHLYFSYDFSKPADFNAFMTAVNNGSLDEELPGNFNPEVRVKRKDKMLVLSTCADAYDIHPDQRWIVCAVPVDDKEK